MPGIDGVRGTMPVASDHVVEAAQVVGIRAPAQLDLDAEPLEPRAEVAQRLGELFLAGDAPREVELAADLAAASNSVTTWPRSAAVVAAAMPGRPGADDGDRLLRSAAARACIPSRGTRTD